jgi:hypothetical protein
MNDLSQLAEEAAYAQPWMTTEPPEDERTSVYYISKAKLIYIWLADAEEWTDAHQAAREQLAQLLEEARRKGPPGFANPDRWHRFLRRQFPKVIGWVRQAELRRRPDLMTLIDGAAP